MKTFELDFANLGTDLVDDNGKCCVIGQYCIKKLGFSKDEIRSLYNERNFGNKLQPFYDAFREDTGIIPGLAYLINDDKGLTDEERKQKFIELFKQYNIELIVKG